MVLVLRSTQLLVAWLPSLLASNPRSATQLHTAESALLLLSSVVAALFLGSLSRAGLVSRLKRHVSSASAKGPSGGVV